MAKNSNVGEHLSLRRGQGGEESSGEKIWRDGRTVEGGKNVKFLGLFLVKNNLMQDLTANNNTISTEPDMVRLAASLL